LIEINGIRILTDPWVIGPSYCNQWYLFPKPPENALDYLKRVDYVLISHGHEDHLHFETLRMVDKNAHIFFPYTWYQGAVNFFKELGFTKITEAVNAKEYNLSGIAKVTFLANNLDNVVVLEAEGKTLVNINDALPSPNQGIISHFIKTIQPKWPKIEYLFSSYGSAAYFPNTVKCKWKNDLDVALIREQFFLNNFCKIAKGINATYSIPFASDFVLLDDEQRWINKVKFSRQGIKQYFLSYFSDSTTTTEVKTIYPGDIIDNRNFLSLSPYHEKFHHSDIFNLSESEYRDEIIIKRNSISITHEEFESIFDKAKGHILRKSYIISPERKKLLKFVLKIVDAPDEPMIRIDLRSGIPMLTLTNNLEADDLFLIKVKSSILLYSINNEWGGDAIIIGYGCEIEVFSLETIREQLENDAIQLLTNYPNTREYIKRNPLRTLNYLLHDQMKRKIFINKMMGKKYSHSPFTDVILEDQELWLTRNNCEICRKCNLPLLTEKNIEFLT
ncbi:MAG: MBL fold metallo-hydrolase, partial [Bacteroidetes bacterium]|nr:MBL fold metallo-hydrolase [Bacteroidota bacterium]